jgi:7-carboxy-7-deazaguanine synthase
VHVETQGSRAPAWLGQVDSVTVSPKGPSSGMGADWSGLDATLNVAEDPDIKIVVFDQADFDYAKEVRRRHPDVPFTLQLGNRVGEDDERSLLERLRWLADLALQLHVLLWGNRRGV